MSEAENLEPGQKLLNAVERITDAPETIISMVEEMCRGKDRHDEATLVEVANKIIQKYSNRSAISGGAAALPGIIPGLGSLAAFAGGTLIDAALILKYEVEMVQALSWLHGFDIREEKERQIALLLASVNTYESKSGRNFFVDLAETQGTAIWNYGPRQVSKMIVSVMTKIALLSLSKGFVRALPFVGIAVGGGMNKVLTQKVGKQSVIELKRRKVYEKNAAAEPAVVEAQLRA